MGVIVSQLLGGLGNQIFQYAAARGASLTSGKLLKIDTSRFSGYALHNGFELFSVFDFKADVATAADIRKVLGMQSLPLIQRIVSRPAMRWIRSSNYVLEPHHNYWSGINNLPDMSYLVGYWQSEKYFNKFNNIIRKDLTFKNELNIENLSIARRLLNTTSVSLHVRRGDYISSQAANNVHGVCTLDYYKSAISYMAKSLEKPHFFIFSDDISWVKKNLQLDFPCEYIDNNFGLNSNIDMRLMSMCKHNIIANSSFSWWGAWLNSNPDKIVIAPKKWFAKAIATEDLIPAEWIIL